MIDQTTLGHKFLKDELGVVPAVGWQIDPFGHSATQGGLLTSGVGFDSLFFGRIHHVDLEHRRQNAECEGLWSSDVDEASVFWGLSGSYGGNYGAPEGFCFDALCDDEPLVGEDEDVLLERIKKFAIALGVQANMTKGRNLMLTMGMDFQVSLFRFKCYTCISACDVHAFFAICRSSILTRRRTSGTVSEFNRDTVSSMPKKRTALSSNMATSSLRRAAMSSGPAH